MDVKTKLSEARSKLATLPHWIKVLMWAQVMLLCFSLGCLAMVLAIQKEQFVAFWNVGVTLMQQLPESGDSRAALRDAVEVGVNGRHWLFGLIATIMASAAIGGIVVGMTPWKMRKQ